MNRNELQDIEINNIIQLPVGKIAKKQSVGVYF